MTGKRPVNTCAHQYITIERRVPFKGGSRIQTLAVCRHCQARRVWHFTQHNHRFSA